MSFFLLIYSLCSDRAAENQTKQNKELWDELTEVGCYEFHEAFEEHNI